MSEPKILHSPMTNRWYIVLAFRNDGSVRKKVDITETLDAILTPASEQIAAKDAQIAELERQAQAREIEARLDEATWWARKIGHIGPAPGIEPDKSCEFCMRYLAAKQQTDLRGE